MSYPIKQSTTAQPLVFLMLDSADHVTGKTGLTPTVTLSKAGGSFASPAGAVTEIGSGWYKVAGNATDSATLGPLLLHATGSGADPCDDRYDVVAFDPQDAVHFGLTALPNVAAGANGGLPLGDVAGNVILGSCADDSITENAFADGAITADAIATEAITESKVNEALMVNFAYTVWERATSTFATPGSIGKLIKDNLNATVGGVPAAVWAVATSTITVAGTIGKLLVDNVNATISSVFSRLGAPSGTSVSADIAAIKAETALILADTGSDGVALSASALTALAEAVTDEPLSGHVTTGTVGASLANVYAAQIDLTDDNDNGRDEYTVQWFNNGNPITSGITSPTIQVVKRLDGTDLVAVTTMTQIGSTGAYKYDESTNRISDGEAVLVQCQATIDGAARTWRKVVGRDDIA